MQVARERRRLCRFGSPKCRVHTLSDMTILQASGKLAESFEINHVSNSTADTMSSKLIVSVITPRIM
jgi:hypothetical protein